VDGTESSLDAAELDLGYRESVLKHAAEGMPEVVTNASFTLTRADPEVIGQRLDVIRRWRQANQPLGLPSAGSVFRNPPGESAGRIVDQLGLKGRRVGGASVSPKHANFIVNDHAGTAADVRRLAEDVRSIVARERGIELELEVAFVGDWSGWEDQA
jgi:UDP-N-acetylmuramate dehydrogenase